MQVRSFLSGALATLTLGLGLFSMPAIAEEPDGDAIIASMDEITDRAQDQVFKYHVVTQEPAKKEPREMTFTVKLKGVKSLTEFESPGDVKGTRVLVMSRSQMYIYLPSFKKVRRIASHVTEQGFMGTTLTQEDMATLKFGELFDGKVLSSDDTSYVVEATAKEGVETGMSKLVFTVRKADFLPTKIEYFNSKGEKARTMTRTDYTCEGDVCTAKVMRMTDHTRNDAWTELRRLEWEVNTGLDDGIFSVRELQRGM